MCICGSVSGLGSLSTTFVGHFSVPHLSVQFFVPSHVVIVGGGLAGLAAAAALSARGDLQVTLLESRSRWGGRASSFVDQTTGETIDNCQHVNLGCGTNFQHFCRTIGIERFFHREDALNFVGPDGRISRFAAASLPAPLHLFPAFLRLRFLSLMEKRQLARGLRALARTQPESNSNESFLDWLRRHGQSQTVIERFWHVVLVSALSETVDRTDIGHAQKVFVDAFLSNRRGWEVWLPTVPLDELYGEALARWFEARGVEAQLQAGVRRVGAAAVESGGMADRAGGVQLRSGEQISADQVILAVPQNLVLPLLPEEWQQHAALAAILQLETAPISSVHLWFDRPVTNLRHVTFVGRLSQWLFNRSAIQEGGARTSGSRSAGGATPPDPPLLRGGENQSEIRNPKSETFYYQVVISASRDVLTLGQEETIRTVIEELAAVWPKIREARLTHSRLLTEHRAVLSMRPGVDRLRPPQQSPIENLHLAGDWTRTGWPSTMEGAVRSGYLAAESVLRQLGRPEQLVQPDLALAPLSKLLFGL